MTIEKKIDEYSVGITKKNHVFFYRENIYYPQAFHINGPPKLILSKEPAE